MLLLKSERRYQPKESEYSVAGLEATLNSLLALNSAANQSWVELKTARMDRNSAFYGNNQSLLLIARQVKSYVKSAFGQKSQQYNTVKSIKFYRVVPVKKAQ